jgi:ATP-dependent DNA helicase RecG
MPSSELLRLTGVGPKRLQALEAAGIRTLRDLVYHVPRRYIDRTRITPISSLREGDEAFFVAHIESVKTPPGRLVVTVADETGTLELAFFNSAHYLKQQLAVGRRISVAGTVKRFRTLQVSHPEWEILDGGQAPRGGLLPVYPLTGELADTRAEHKLLQKIALEALETFAFSDAIPPEQRTLLGLRPEKEALRALHAPESTGGIEAARMELKVRELWPLAMQRVKARRARRTRGKAFSDTDAIMKAEAAFRAALPFAPTGGQEEALRAIGDGLANRQGAGQFFGLLHGDVGSGKTAVAALSAIRVAASGSQVALLAPTEILASQHARTLIPLFAAAGLKAALLTGDTPTPERRAIEEGLRDGSIAVAMGTHALLSAGVRFRDLRFVIVDEQHRFGVDQRAALTGKGLEPHVLYLSATPIPRTLAQSLYGDMEVLMLREKPAGRLPVKTRLVPAMKQAELMGFLRDETLKNANQVYWVVPRVNSEGIEEDATPAIENAVKRLKSAGEWKVEAVHGKVPAPEREKILAAFRRGEVHALAATTVIEVGVDVPAANLMVVEGAERFGMAQLHQLRGRTGRGSAQAWCFLLEPPAFGWPEETEARLKAFASTEDGFAIAEMDLKQRGAGSFAGTAQSGFGELRFSDLVDDAELIRDLVTKAETLPS